MQRYLLIVFFVFFLVIGNAQTLYYTTPLEKDVFNNFSAKKIANALDIIGAHQQIAASDLDNIHAILNNFTDKNKKLFVQINQKKLEKLVKNFTATFLVKYSEKMELRKVLETSYNENYAMLILAQILTDKQIEAQLDLKKMVLLLPNFNQQKIIITFNNINNPKKIVANYSLNPKADDINNMGYMFVTPFSFAIQNYMNKALDLFQTRNYFRAYQELQKYCVLNSNNDLLFNPYNLGYFLNYTTTNIEELNYRIAFMQENFDRIPKDTFSQNFYRDIHFLSAEKNKWYVYKNKIDSTNNPIIKTIYQKVVAEYYYSVKLFSEALHYAHLAQKNLPMDTILFEIVNASLYMVLDIKTKDFLQRYKTNPSQETAIGIEFDKLNYYKSFNDSFFNLLSDKMQAYFLTFACAYFKPHHFDTSNFHKRYNYFLHELKTKFPPKPIILDLDREFLDNLFGRGDFQFCKTIINHALSVQPMAAYFMEKKKKLIRVHNIKF